MAITQLQKLNKEVKILKKDLRQVKSFLLAPMKDQEGDYQTSFIKKVFSRAQKRGPFYKFSGKDKFLKDVEL